MAQADAVQDQRDVTVVGELLIPEADRLADMAESAVRAAPVAERATAQRAVTIPAATAAAPSQRQRHCCREDPCPGDPFMGSPGPWPPARPCHTSAKFPSKQARISGGSSARKPGSGWPSRAHTPSPAM